MNRIDKILVDQGLAESRTQAQKLISAGAVTANICGKLTVIGKASIKYPENIELNVDVIEELKYVSRAGLKLESAFKEMQMCGLLDTGNLTKISSGKTILDVGQSTGGFTDFLLKTGADKVVGIDVGRDQLAPSLRDNKRVVYFEGINARELPSQELLEHASGGFDWVVMDVSFISQTLIIPHLAECLTEDGFLISLVKPQFEAGKNNIGKGGIVRNKNAFKTVKQRVCDCIAENGLSVCAYFKSSLPGMDGNQEFFVVAKKST